MSVAPSVTNDRVRELIRQLDEAMAPADDAARAARRARDEQMADALERDGDVEGFVERWLAMPMFATLPRDRADVAARLGADVTRREYVGADHCGVVFSATPDACDFLLENLEV